MKLFKSLLITAAVATAASCSKKEAVTLETVEVSRTDVCEVVTATGTLESVTQVEVGTQVTGIVSKLFADYNSEVAEGQIIAEIDKTTLESSLRSADARVLSAKETFDYCKKNYERDRQLHDKQLISDYEFDTTKKDYIAAKAQYDQAQADRTSAARNLSYAEIFSPINGIVISRAVEVGQTVVANMSVANLFTIADLDNMQVVANVDEADIGGVKVGQNASFSVDAYPNDVFYGKVTQVRISPTTTSNVVTYEVLINAANPEHKLIPGLTANVTINIKEAHDVLAIPLRTLRFAPQEYKNAEGLPSFDPVPESETPHRTVWVLRNNHLSPVKIETGIDNGVDCEVTKGLKEGDVVALFYDELTPATADNERDQVPFMPKPPKRDNNKDKNKK